MNKFVVDPMTLPKEDQESLLNTMKDFETMIEKFSPSTMPEKVGQGRDYHNYSRGYAAGCRRAILTIFGEEFFKQLKDVKEVES